MPSKKPKQKSNSEEIKRWIEQAEADLNSAKNSYNSKDYYLSAFMCQQAVEKMCQQAIEKILKAFYLEVYGELRKIHDLVYFARKLNLSEDIILKCDELTKAYIETRYPDIGSGKIPAKKFSKIDAEKFLRIADEVSICIKKMI